jgi:hypothetical protein
MDHPVETITPELALVDPDFAAMARVRLASPGDCLAPRARPAPRVERVPVRAHEAEPPRSARGRRTVERVAIVATWLLAAGILGSSLLAFIPPQRSSRPEIRDDGTAFAAGGTALQPSPAVQPPASIPAQGRGNAVTTADGGIEIRWPADRRATLYNVIVLRDGARIDLWPTTNETASIPPDALWVARRAKGIRYRWFVYPGYRSGKSVHYGPVLAQGSTIARSVPRR